MITIQFVGSSNIREGQYDPDTKEMTIEFQNRTRYLYSNVSREEWDGLVSADSPGSYFHRVIKSTKPCVKLGQVESEAA